MSEDDPPASKKAKPNCEDNQIKKWLLQVDENTNSVYLTLLDSTLPSKSERDVMVRVMSNRGFLKSGGKFCVIKLVGKNDGSSIFEGGTILKCSLANNVEEQLVLVVKKLQKDSERVSQLKESKKPNSLKVLEKRTEGLVPVPINRKSSNALTSSKPVETVDPISRQRNMLKTLQAGTANEIHLNKQPTLTSSHYHNRELSLPQKALIPSRKAVQCQYQPSSTFDKAHSSGLSTYPLHRPRIGVVATGINRGSTSQHSMLFQQLSEDSLDRLLPPQWQYKKSDGVFHIFEINNLSTELSISRSVQVFRDQSLRVTIGGKDCSQCFGSEIHNIKGIQTLINEVSKSNLCSGCEGFGLVIRCEGGTCFEKTWYSKNCSRILRSASGRVPEECCSECRDLKNSLRFERSKMIKKLKEREKERMNDLSKRATKVSSARLQIGRSVYNLLNSFWKELGLDEAAVEWKSKHEICESESNVDFESLDFI